MIEVSSKKFICIVDESKLSKRLGPKFPLPIEITPFCHLHTMRCLEKLPSLSGCRAVLRLGRASTNTNPDNSKEIAVTDNGNYIVDLYFKDGASISDVKAAAAELKTVVGVSETLFLLFFFFLSLVIFSSCFA